MAGFNLGDYVFDFARIRSAHRRCVRQSAAGASPRQPFGGSAIGNALHARALEHGKTWPHQHDAGYAACSEACRRPEGTRAPNRLTPSAFTKPSSGAFPFQKLSVSQIPGTFGQGWPGLLYLSTYSYLPAEAQQRAGLSESGQEHFTELVPFHEVAHQWWGNVVGWDSYSDQWINEAIANYLALLFADTQKRTDHSLHMWLGRYRQNLVEKSPTSELTRIRKSAPSTWGIVLHRPSLPPDSKRSSMARVPG